MAILFDVELECFPTSRNSTFIFCQVLIISCHFTNSFLLGFPEITAVEGARRATGTAVMTYATLCTSAGIL